MLAGNSSPKVSVASSNHPKHSDMPEAKRWKVWLYSIRKADSSSATHSVRMFSSKRWKQVRLGEAHDDAEIQLKAEGCTAFDS